MSNGHRNRARATCFMAFMVLAGSLPARAAGPEKPAPTPPLVAYDDPDHCQYLHGTYELNGVEGVGVCTVIGKKDVGAHRRATRRLNHASSFETRCEVPMDPISLPRMSNCPFKQTVASGDRLSVKAQGGHYYLVLKRGSSTPVNVEVFPEGSAAKGFAWMESKPSNPDKDPRYVVYLRPMPDTTSPNARGMGKYYVLEVFDPSAGTADEWKKCRDTELPSVTQDDFTCPDLGVFEPLETGSGGGGEPPPPK